MRQRQWLAAGSSLICVLAATAAGRAQRRQLQAKPFSIPSIIKNNAWDEAIAGTRFRVPYDQQDQPASSRKADAALQRELALRIQRAGMLRVIARPAAGQLKHRYLIPGAGYYQLFDWDTYFMGVALSYHGRGRSLASSVEDFLDFTNSRAGYRGYTPREATAKAFWALPEQCKPFLAQMALRASQTLGSAAWLRPYYKRLADTLAYWRQARRAPDGLYTWFDGVESGVDNSPAVSSQPANVTEGVDLACYLVREDRAMAALAKMLNKNNDAERYTRRARRLTRLIQTRLWDAPEASFYNRDRRTGKFVRVPEWTNLTPLWARVATPAQARAIIEQHLLNPKEFWSAYGVRTLAAESPQYNPASGYWRGPIWIVTDYMMMHGLMHYGYPQQARQLARRTARLLLADFKATGGMHECYDPRSGAGEAQGHFESWDLLGAVMIHEAWSGENAASVKTAITAAPRK